MKLYKGTCCYRELDGELYQEIKVVEAESRAQAELMLHKFFFKKYSYLPQELFLFSTVKEVNNSNIILGNKSISQTGKTNINIGITQGLSIGDNYS